MKIADWYRISQRFMLFLLFIFFFFYIFISISISISFLFFPGSTQFKLYTLYAKKKTQNNHCISSFQYSDQIDPLPDLSHQLTFRWSLFNFYNRMCGWKPTTKHDHKWETPCSDGQKTTVWNPEADVSRRGGKGTRWEWHFPDRVTSPGSWHAWGALGALLSSLHRCFMCMKTALHTFRG